MTLVIFLVFGAGFCVILSGFCLLKFKTKTSTSKVCKEKILDFDSGHSCSSKLRERVENFKIAL